MEYDSDDIADGETDLTLFQISESGDVFCQQFALTEMPEGDYLANSNTKNAIDGDLAASFYEAVKKREYEPHKYLPDPEV